MRILFQSQRSMRWERTNTFAKVLTPDLTALLSHCKSNSIQILHMDIVHSKNQMEQSSSLTNRALSTFWQHFATKFHRTGCEDLKIQEWANQRTHFQSAISFGLKSLNSKIFAELSSSKLRSLIQETRNHLKIQIAFLLRSSSNAATMP